MSDALEPRKRWFAGTLLATFLLLAQEASAQGPLPSPLFSPPAVVAPVPVAESSPSPTLAPDLSRADLEPFLDGLISSQIENRDIAGAIVSVVREGQVILERGYGFADFERREPVVAKETLFRPGSISKLFTAIAVMQLVEQGKVDLDREVRDYLDFDIPRNFPEPITLRRILTHTAGFEETLKDLFGSPDKPVPPLREYLIGHIPAQIFRPGTVPAYSNYAVSLAGYIVERMALHSFDQYVDERIFQPLGMISSTFAQPLPEPLKARMSNGYAAAAKAAQPFEICVPSPAGALSTTATDMSRFMLALLGNGALDGATILQPETLRTMQSRQNELHPDLHAMGLGFIDYSRNGRTMWGHAGDTLQFHSDLFLIPDARVGVFISYNSGGNRPGSGRGELLRAFLDRYYPAADASLAPALSETIAHARAVSGVYEVSRKSETNRLRVGALLGQVTVRGDREGAITIENSRNVRGQIKRWREVTPFVYREINGPDRIAFQRDQNGEVTALLPNTPIYVAQRVSGLRSKTILLPLVGGSLAFIGLTLLLWPVAVLVRKWYGRALLPDARSRRLYFFSRVVCLLLVGMLVALAIPFALLESDISFLSDKINPWLRVSQVLGCLGGAGLLILAIAAFHFWRTPAIRWWTRMHATLLLLTALIFVWFACQWHMLTPSLKF